MQTRLYYLDNLKTLLTVLVIFHHAGQAYGDGGDWGYTPTNPAEVIPWIWHFFSTNAAFFMGLYFFIAGYFVPISFDRQGAKQFVKKKFVRLGIPLVAMSLFISSLSGKVEVAHLWFVESLLIFSLAYALLRSVSSPISAKQRCSLTLPGLLLFGLLMGSGSYFIRQVSPQDHWVSLWLWTFEPAHYLQYLLMFVGGILAYRFHWLEQMNRHTGLTALTIGLLLAFGNYLVGDNCWGHFVGHWFGFYESLLCVFISTGLLWFFREWGGWTHRFWRWSASQSYGAYIFHLPLMIGFQYLVDDVWMGAVGKFLCVGIVITLVSYLFTWLVRMIPGVKRVL